MRHTAYIGIGSNLGNKLKNCEAAVDYIASLDQTNIMAQSNWHENPAAVLAPDEKQPDYINGAVKIETGFGPAELLSKLKEIEISMGRPADHRKWLPRTIDLDLLLYDDLVWEGETLTIPHPEAAKRIFVLKPLCDIEPELAHPVLRKTMLELLGELKRQYPG